MIDLPPIWTSKIQGYIFRELLSGFSYPGKVQDLSLYLEEHSACEAILPAILDSTVTLADPDNKLSDQTWQYLNCKSGMVEQAQYVIADGREEPLFTPNCGELLAPEAGSTVILDIDSVETGEEITISGPGVNGTKTIAVDGIDSKWLSRSIRQNSGFPRGVDLILCDRKKFICLPRTTKLEAY